MTHSPALTSASTTATPQPRAASGRHGSWPQIRIFLLLALVSLPAVTSRIYASDEVQYFSFLRSLWFDRDVSFENEYQHFYDSGVARDYNFHETFLERTTETGRRVSFATVGSALLWAPFYAVADAGVLLARAGGSAVPRDGYAWPYVAAVCYGSAIYGIAALLLSIRAAGAVGLGTPHSVLAALAIWIGTPLLFYTHLAPAMAHATAAFAVALFVVVWLHVRERWTLAGGLALGAAGALMVMVREQDVTFFAAPAIDLAMRVLKNPQQWLRPALRATVGAALACGLSFLPQAAAYLALNGRIGPSRLVSRKMNWLTPHAWGILASPEHGYFLWTPLALVALSGLVVMATRLWRGQPLGNDTSLPMSNAGRPRRRPVCGVRGAGISARLARFMDVGGRLRPAPFRELDDSAGLWACDDLLDNAAPADSAPGSRFRRPADLVEPRADGRVRDTSDGSAAARAEKECL